MVMQRRSLLLILLSIQAFTSQVYCFGPAAKRNLPAVKQGFTKQPSPVSSRNGEGKKSPPHVLNKIPLDKDPEGVAPDFPLTIPRIGITIASTVLTWYAQRQYTNVMASSALTLACSMCFDKRLGQATFCGSFAGMGSAALIPNWKYAFGLGAITSALFEALIHHKNAYLGVGGRLGATAFLASSAIAIMQGIPTGVAISAMSLSSLQKSLSVILPMAIWHAVGSVATIALREASDESKAADPVRASAVVGLIGALLLDKTAALGVYGGSFVGMSLPSRLMHGIIPGNNVSKPPAPTVFSLFASFAIAGAFAGIVHGATIGLGFWPGGWGGKAGFCSFLGCLIYRGIEKTMVRVSSIPA